MRNIQPNLQMENGRNCSNLNESARKTRAARQNCRKNEPGDQPEKPQE